MESLTAILEAVDQGDLSAFTDEQLAEHKEAIRQYGLSLKKDNPSDEEIADATTLAGAFQTVNEELSRRQAAASERQEKADAAFSAFGDPEPEATEESEPVEEPIQASRPSAAEVAKRRPFAAEPKVEEKPRALVAAALDDEDKIGTRFIDQLALAAAMKKAWDRTPSGMVDVARIPIENRYNLDGDEVDNWNTVNKVARGSQEARNNDVGLIAALGCAPSEPIYEFFNLSDRGAGLVDLPSVTARRGSRTYPPLVGYTNISGQAGIGTQYAAGVTKSCYTVACGTTRPFEVLANYVCLTFQNEMQFFYPEMIAQYQGLALVAYEHVVNQRLIEGMRDAAITSEHHDLDTGGGTTTALIRSILRVRSYYIQRHKMAENSVLDVVMPFWFAAAYGADVIARQSTDMGTSVNVGLMRIQNELRQAGVNAQFVYDWQTDSAAGFEDFGSYLIYAPGTFVQIDGPTLDLGVVRDSTLNAANDFQVFYEGWTGLAEVGTEALYIQGVETCPSGQAALTTAITCGAS
jgi:hypothetical protein